MKSLRGFSLLEALIVLAIVAVLGALLVPMGHSIRSRMDQAQCLANLRRIGGAIHLYAQDHNRLLPGPAPGLVIAQYGRGNFSDPRAASHYLLTYLGYQQLKSGAPMQMMEEFICPAARKTATGDDRELGRHYGQFPSIYQGKPTIPDPSNSDRALYPFGYKAGLTTITQYPVRIDQIARPSRAAAFSDRWNLSTSDGVRSAHDDRRNFLFFDGHVRTVPRTEMISNTEIATW